MSDYEKSKSSWRELKKRIMHKLEGWCVSINRKCKPISDWLKACVCFDILERIGHLAIVVAVIFYFVESGDRRKAKHYQAWQTISAAQGKKGDLGRTIALQDLHRDGISLAGVDISKATLKKLNLEKADLSEAILSEAILIDANFSGANLRLADLYDADLHKANLSDANLALAILDKAYLKFADLPDANLAHATLDEADLRYADLSGAILTEIKNWEQIIQINNAYIHGVKDAPVGFKEWAKDRGAFDKEDKEEWRKLRREKMQEQEKKEQQK